MIKWDTLKTSQDLLADKVAQHCEALNQQRDTLISAGLVHNGHKFQTRPKDIADLMGALQVAQLANATGQVFTTNWLTEDNITVTLGLNELAALGTAVALHKSSLVYKCREHKDNLLAKTTLAEVESYMSNLEW